MTLCPSTGHHRDRCEFARPVRPRYRPLRVSLCLLSGLILLPAGCSGGADDGPAADSSTATNGALVGTNGSRQRVPVGENGNADAKSKTYTIALVRNDSEEDVGTKQGGRFEVRGVDQTALDKLAEANLDGEAWRRLFAVRVVDESEIQYPPMLGEFRVQQDRLIFEPQFPLRAGMSYRAVFDPGRLPGGKPNSFAPDSRSPAPWPPPVLSREFSLPPVSTEPTAVVTQIYPTADVLPENQLKFYLHFSAPMSRGEAYRRIHLLDAKGNVVPYPFLELDEELWDHTGTRFTLFIDPGRIKQGLKPREDVGPALEEGKSYTFVVDREWLDASGVPMKQPFRKAFQVGPPDTKQPDHEKWRLTAPPAGTTDPLEVVFGEPLDQGMLMRVLRVTNAAGEPLAGTVEIDRKETRWRFRPDDRWLAGDYSLVVDAALEDLAGNSITRPFEVDVFRSVQRSVTTKTVSRSFTVKPAMKDEG